MSKLSQLHAELSEQAAELGFESLDEALANGYEVDYEAKELVNPYVLCDKAQGEAHEAWLKEKEEILEELKNLHELFVEEDDLHYSIVIAKAIDFIEKGDC